MAPVVVAAAWKRSLEGRVVSPREGGIRLYLLDVMAREATQEPGGWRPQGVMGRVYNKTRCEEVASGMRGALGRACVALKVEEFAKHVEL